MDCSPSFPYWPSQLSRTNPPLYSNVESGQHQTPQIYIDHLWTSKPAVEVERPLYGTSVAESGSSVRTTTGQIDDISSMSTDPDDGKGRCTHAFLTQADSLMTMAACSPRQCAMGMMDVALDAIDEEILHPTQIFFENRGAGVITQREGDTIEPEWHYTYSLVSKLPAPDPRISGSVAGPSTYVKDGSFQTTPRCRSAYLTRQQLKTHSSPSRHREIASRAVKNRSALAKSILPSSARQSALGASIVLEYPVPDWLMGVLKRTKAVPHFTSLSGTPARLQTAIGTILSRANATWWLTSITIPWTTSPTSSTSSISHESSHYPSSISVYGHVVHADFVYAKEMSFRLTEATIDAFWDSFKSLGTFETTEEGREGAFRASLRTYIPIVSVQAFLGLQRSGSGELQDSLAGQVKRETKKKLRQAISCAKRFEQLCSF